MATEVTAFTCESCKYFVFHYVKIVSGFTVTKIGHCEYSVIKVCDRDSIACINYDAKKELTK